jgi:Holliday junction resolvase RusA-like endonuclease
VAVLMAGKISPIDGPIGLEATFYLSRPTRLLRKSDPDEAILHFKMPDLDNLLKGLLDALNGIVWYDDRQVCQILARKYFSEKNEDPRIEIIIKEMTDA